MKLPYSGYLQRPNGPLLLYYITDRRQFSGNPQKQKRRLLDKISECVAARVDYIQLREKDLSTREMEALACAVARLFPAGSASKLLINSRIDVALACGAAGVHLPSRDLPASEARAIFSRAGNVHPIVGASVHSTQELSYAEAHGADFAVFGPVFEKEGKAIGAGVKALEEACGKPDRAMPVLALGGITLENARQCIQAGADGIAAIRLFQDQNVHQLAAQLRAEFL